MQDLITRGINLESGTVENKREEILTYFIKTWTIYEKLYTQLKSNEVFYHRADPLRHVLLFYLGHTAVFFINKLLLAKIIDNRIHPEFESIFAIGVDEMSWDDLNDKNYSWPSVQAVKEYREKAKSVITDVIKTMPLTLPIKWEDPFWIIIMGIEHERIHLETSSVLIRQLPLDEVVSGAFGEICKLSGLAPQNELVNIPSAEIKLGKPENQPFYGWDNEYGQRTEKIEPYQTSKYLISNGEFLQFVTDNGYHNQEYWTEEGWNWKNYKQAEMPLFWRKESNDYILRLVAEEIPMPWNWPAEVNYLEAKAFCNWKSIKESKNLRLPTEAEWYQMIEKYAVPDQQQWTLAPGNIGLEHFSSPCPVDTFRNGELYDLIGNVWQWTETPITGFAGFKVHPLYDDFSTPTFDGKHNIIKGGSWISTGNEATQHARYAFRRHFYQHAGFRIVVSNQTLDIQNDDYETDTEVANSCEDNWTDNVTNSPNFSKALAEFVFNTVNKTTIKKVLNLNANTGRLAFELAPHFESITAIDFSARFIRMPIQLQDKGFMRYIIQDEGELVFYRDVVLEDFDLGKNKEKILFMQDNANNLKPIYSNYDLIIAPNLLEELTCPILFLQNIHERLNDHGMLIIISTYDWELNKIKPEHWPGGFKKDGEPVTSFDGISKILSSHFILEQTPINMTQSLRKSSRTSEIKLCEVSVWRKKT